MSLTSIVITKAIGKTEVSFDAMTYIDFIENFILMFDGLFQHDKETLSCTSNMKLVLGTLS